MGFSNFFKPAPKVRPQLNVGCLMDIPTGRYELGKHGESILNGGVAYITGIGGRGNSFKSVMLQFMLLCILARYSCTAAQFHDTETSATLKRLLQLALSHSQIAGRDLEDEGRLQISDNTVMSGNEWFAQICAWGKEKLKEAKKNTVTTPFIDEKTQKFIEVLAPTVSGLDSLSMLQTDSVTNIYEKNQIGDGGANTDALRGSAAKSQMLMQLPTVTGQGSIYMIMTAHVGDDIPLDPYAPPAKKLAFLKGKAKFKHVPEKFTFLTNNLWYVHGTQVLANKGTKAPEFPRDQNDNMEGDTDLQMILVQNLRAKSGPTGMPFEVIVSQSEGVLVGLTEFNYIRSFDRFGLGGNDRSYYLELVPDIGLSRTTIRGKLQEHAKLRRAMEITSELCQMWNLWDETQGFTIDLKCTAKELFDDLKAQGYDWDVLLNTRGYWVFEEQAGQELPFLSTFDLLRMRRGLYRPYWMEASAKNK